MVQDYAKFTSDAAPRSSYFSWKAVLALFVLVVAAFMLKHPWRAAEKTSSSAATAPKAPLVAVQPYSAQAADEPKFDFYDLLADGDEPVDVHATKIAPTSPIKQATPAKGVTQVKKTVTTVAAPKPVKVKTTHLMQSPKPVTTKTAAKKRSHKSGQQKPYVVSLGDYKTHRVAQKNRAKMLLRGVDAKVSELKTTSGSHYRVALGPYNNWRAAHAAQLTLEQQHQIRGKIVQ